MVKSLESTIFSRIFTLTMIVNYNKTLGLGSMTVLFDDEMSLDQPSPLATVTTDE